ncbi:MAG: DUF1232 domain-containing protein [Clostridiales bacterium]|nr:DUF1232 domain-containing protein [Clostridiales bacterium]MCF8021320.1 DUF1232 domain-containing protein [Clostridiales bacterium]
MKTYYYDSKSDKFVSNQEKLAKELIMLLPNFLKLIYRLMKDSRVPSQNKVLLGAVAAYILSPIDIVPDFVPLVGQVDDLLAVALVLKGLFDAAGEEIVLEYWDGPDSLLSIVDSILKVAAQILPKKAYQRVNKRF